MEYFGRKVSCVGHQLPAWTISQTTNLLVEHRDNLHSTIAALWNTHFRTACRLRRQVNKTIDLAICGLPGPRIHAWISVRSCSLLRTWISSGGDRSSDCNSFAIFFKAWGASSDRVDCQQWSCSWGGPLPLQYAILPWEVYFPLGVFFAKVKRQRKFWLITTAKVSGSAFETISVVWNASKNVI